MGVNRVTLKGLLKSGAFFSLVLLFSGCEWPWDKKQKETKVAVVQEQVAKVSKPSQEKALFLIDGNVSITETEFKEHLEKIVAMNPQFKHIIETVPSVRYNIFTGMMNEKVLKAWIQKSNIDTTKEYQKDYALAVNMLEYELARKYFQDEIAKEVAVTASEIKAYYDEHKKDNPSFIAQQAQVHLVGTKFDSEKARDVFIDKIKGSEKDIQKKAQELKVFYKDLGTITKESKDIDAGLKKAALSFGKDMSHVKVKDAKGACWCLVALDVKEAEYHPLSQMQDGIEQMLKGEKITTAYTKKLEGLKVTYHVEEKKEYFDMPAQQNVLDQVVAERKEDNKETQTARVA